MMDTVLMQEMTWMAFANHMKRKAPVLLPVGATEQHGYDMPLGVDAYLPMAVATGVAKEIGAIVAPVINYGFKSQPKMGGGPAFPGTTSFDGNTLIAAVRDILRDLVRHDARRIAVINGHYENQMFTIEAIELARRDAASLGISDLTVFRCDYWDFTRESVLAKLFPAGFPGYALEHAAILETSMMLHLRPDLVDVSKLANDGPAKFPPYETFPVRDGWVPPSGVLSPAGSANAEKGRLLMENYVEDIAAALRKEFSLT
jgi:creatinine amidohydrolase